MYIYTELLSYVTSLHQHPSCLSRRQYISSINCWFTWGLIPITTRYCIDQRKVFEKTFTVCMIVDFMNEINEFILELIWVFIVVISIAHHVRLINLLDVSEEEGGGERGNDSINFSLPCLWSIFNRGKNQHMHNTYQCSLDKMINLE